MTKLNPYHEQLIIDLEALGAQIEDITFGRRQNWSTYGTIKNANGPTLWLDKRMANSIKHAYTLIQEKWPRPEKLAVIKNHSGYFIKITNDNDNDGCVILN